MKPNLVEVVAYQETLLIMAVFGVAILAMIWVGFRRWLQSKERMDRLLGERAAEQTAQFDSHFERVEARLNAMEQMLTDGGVQAQLEPSVNPATDAISKADPLR